MQFGGPEAPPKSGANARRPESLGLRVQFGLRTFFCVVVSVAIVLRAIVLPAIHRGALVKWVENQGGCVVLQCDLDDPWRRDRRKGWSLFSEKIGAVHLTSTDVSCLPRNVSREGIRELDISGTRITDLNTISGIRSLRVLAIDGLRIESLAPIENLRELQVLSMTNVELAKFQEKLEPLENLPKLEMLYLGPIENGVTKKLRELLPNCEIVVIRRPRGLRGEE